MTEPTWNVADLPDWPASDAHTFGPDLTAIEPVGKVFLFRRFVVDFPPDFDPDTDPESLVGLPVTDITPDGVGAWTAHKVEINKGARKITVTVYDEYPSPDRHPAD